MFKWLKNLFGESDSVPSIETALKYFRQGNFTKALDCAEEIIALGPEVALSWRFKAECLEELQRYPEALECFQKALDLGGPGTEELINRVALVQFCSDQKDAAIATLTSVIEGDAATELKQQAQEMLTEFSRH